LEVSNTRDQSQEPGVLQSLFMNHALWSRRETASDVSLILNPVRVSSFSDKNCHRKTRGINITENIRSTGLTDNPGRKRGTVDRVPYNQRISSGYRWSDRYDQNKNGRRNDN